VTWGNIVQKDDEARSTGLGGGYEGAARICKRVNGENITGEYERWRFQKGKSLGVEARFCQQPPSSADERLKGGKSKGGGVMMVG